MRVHFTDATVRTLKATDRQIRVWDTTTPGFGLTVGLKRKSWIVMHGRGRALKVLGRYPDLSLKDARLAASRYLLGGHETAPADTKVSAAFESYASAYCDTNMRESTAKETKRLLKAHLLPTLGGKSIRSVRKSDITKILDPLLPTPSAANHAFAALRGFFNWAVRRDLLEASPCDRLKMPARHSTRERVLTAAELAIVWSAARRFPYPFGSIVQLLILTGQRRGEIAALRWDWIDEKQQTIALPASITKNKREQLVPYGDMAATVLETIPRQGPYLFPAARDRIKGKPATIFNGWGKPKAALDAAIKGELERSPVAPWTLHDLRRTASTMWARLGIPQHVNDRLLNHISGSVTGVAAIYNRYEYLDEKRTALASWEQRLASLDVGGRS